MTIDAKELGLSLRMVRKKRGLTQHDLAHAVGVSVNYIWLIENGRRKPSIGVLNQIAGTLDVPAPCLTMLGFTPRNRQRTAYRDAVNATKTAILAAISAD